MFKFLLLAFFVASAYGGVTGGVHRDETSDKHFNEMTEGRIIGGQSADIRDAPHQAASLRSSGGTYRQSCGGSIVRANVIVTAAHCTFGSSASSWRIRVGSTSSSSGGQLMEPSRIVNHGSYSSSGFDYDISFYVLTGSITLDGTTRRAIALPNQDQSVADGASALITGWGSTSEGGSTVDGLRRVTTVIVNQSRCAQAYSQLTSRMICAGNLANGGQDACQGDSGGPMVVSNTLIGITSYGRGCGRAGYPGVYARVPSFRNWLNTNMP